ncbi:MAG: Peptidyl-prolyl cis-trans isomerase [Candidatus Nomurabacteria bacterium GW2011_GWE1_32_28]|uniref:Peptidyl-prolyl cis-trans isomerase n=1 Tax=Candidatus Nomurabacteria bacterium GW2011_GWF1_31_48 TaxID=1618767 RepID=A0A0F9YV33_9BACT|nr:MAG: Peptidyl-prolyl cis-trans isomerase [Candidatus Nomurabacteria bacterium GW2011_GWF2_30_133]KKP28739.1 MAG: Peptidyl-prolyl cis-trans isomerase [Candidatus Nomurabacteria bacterium GW2011_GWE2_31_40]KKP30316.1 MAG: Peptidyl-prolyl cis-trans isomerase [Candidatus Nomurabacteria bacterium GW2011_GWF1_31_48]KKP34843.1 MAG: Peptidyl-prolyl cis-trans isomerase [Candidatus Nomurabacteria bacterium GW2011_GWE1_32_28]
MKEFKMNIIVSFVIFLAVILILVFISINNKEEILKLNDIKVEQKSMQNIKQSEGVKITVLKEGNGEVVKSGDIVSVNYTGRLITGTVFDSNIDPEFGHVDPLIFVIGEGRVIEGWEIGIVGMKTGEKRVLEIAPEFAYGENEIGPIPSNSTLIFEVELLKIGQ